MKKWNDFEDFDRGMEASVRHAQTLGGYLMPIVIILAIVFSLLLALGGMPNEGAGDTPYAQCIQKCEEYCAGSGALIEGPCKMGCPDECKHLK